MSSTQTAASIPGVPIAEPEADQEITYYGRKVPHVRDAFNAVTRHGERHKYQGEPWVGDMINSHVQGVAPYGKYLFLTHNNKGGSRGFLLIVNRRHQKLVRKVETPHAHFNHPGGCQMIGSYLAVAVENSDASESYICFYECSEMTDRTGPRLLSRKIHRSTSGAGGVGITSYTGEDGRERYVVAVYDDGTVDFYRSNGAHLSSPSNKFTFLGSADPEVTGYSEMCLLTQQDQKLYLVGFRTKDLGFFGDNEDTADLYHVTLDPPSIHPRMETRHMVTTYGPMTGVTGVHFRYGAGLEVRPDLTLEFYATQRNFDGNEFYTNTFPTK